MKCKCQRWPNGYQTSPPDTHLRTYFWRPSGIVVCRTTCSHHRCRKHPARNTPHSLARSTRRTAAPSVPTLSRTIPLHTTRRTLSGIRQDTCHPCTRRMSLSRTHPSTYRSCSRNMRHMCDPSTRFPPPGILNRTGKPIRTIFYPR